MIGPFVEAVEKVSQAFHVDPGEFELSDLKDEEFTRSLAILEIVAVKGVPIERIANSFLARTQADLPIENVPLVPVIMDIPVVLNLKTKERLVVHCSGIGIPGRGRKDLRVTL